MKEALKETLFLSPVTETEINKIVRALKDSATGHDDISSQFLKLALNSIVDPLTHICNMSLTEGVFLNTLKVANVIPLYKSDDPMCFNHYRPVSLLCILSKVFEKIMYRKWQDYVYIQCEYKSTKQKIKHLLREENKVKENKIS